MAFKKTFVISDESVNSYGFVVLTDGIDLSVAEKNCPAFYMHRTWEVPLGHWENLRKVDGQLLADLVIEGVTQADKDLIKKIENGDVKGSSCGLDPVSWTEDVAVMKPGQTAPTLSKSILFEASIAPLPGNKNCLALKHSGSLLVLSEGSNHNIIPPLNQKVNMKKIALTLGLKDDASEADIIGSISTLLHGAENAEAMRKYIEDEATVKLSSEPARKLFVELTKTNFPQALALLSLSNGSGEDAAEAGTKGAGKKAVTLKKETLIADLIQKGKVVLSTDDGKDSFDYLQRHNSVELQRINTEEPEKYQELLTDYQKGVRYQPNK